MPLERMVRIAGRVLHVVASRALLPEEYRRLVSELESVIDRFDTARVLFEIHAFDPSLGARPDRLWEGIEREGLERVERLALVGDVSPGGWRTGFLSPFVRARIACFESSDAPRARDWLVDDLDEAERDAALEAAHRT